ncbi:MAG TPA: hypothetical protein VMI32_01195 [Candidatus Solibacter sp.]|nr:hypothetical protein [Candidatus Solibacter sp.]
MRSHSFFVLVLCSLGLFFALLVCAATPSPGDTQRKTTKSPHGASLKIPCENCHNVAAWRPIREVPEFDHNTTKYPLRGMHEKVKCTSCHANPVFTDVGENCQDCHSDVHQRKMGSDCASCHIVSGWKVLTKQLRDHQNRFPLFGAHASVPCEECHKSAAVGQYQGLSTLCISCHQKDYQSATNPNHAASGFPTTCETCHSVDSWSGANFDHAAAGFPLAGGHANLPCASCHINNNYSLTSTDCIGCHLDAWNSTPTYGGNVPDHIKAGFPQTGAACAMCHPITQWSDGKFAHSTTGWALAGAHVTTPCSSCHLNSNYALTSANTDCYGCHSAAWQSTTTLGGGVPNHIAAGYPTTCDTCHTTTSWLGATFDHTYFPIPHHASVCSDCHLVSTDYSTFSCVNCHTQSAHQKMQTDQTHNGVGGYVYGPTTCYNCHKNGGT